ncbi:MAG: M56 family metallopeptidase [Opitutaceae bacterium]
MILTELLNLGIRGALVLGLVWVLEQLLAGRMQAGSRRGWWWIVAAAFLVPMNLMLLPTWANGISTAPIDPTVLTAKLLEAVPDNPVGGETLHVLAPIVFIWVWLGGALFRIGSIVWQTFFTQRRWGSMRLCTDSALLEILEDCKAQAGVNAPIGLIVTPKLNSPAILGWLRPRILLPTNFVAEASPARLRAVFLHELAHYRAGDLGLHWLFQIVLTVHWFNPFAYVAVRQWLRFREIAADEQAIKWLGHESRQEYGATLIATLRQQNDFPSPSGALALGESVQNLKQRITMIASRSHLPRHRFLAFAFGLLFATTLLVQTIRAEDEDQMKAAAVSAASQWLELLDQQQYTASWDDASPFFKSKVSRKQWSETLTQVRTPLGKQNSRTQASILLQPFPNDSTNEKTLMVVIQYRSSFENLASAAETLTFIQDADGQWRAGGYFIKPI